MGLGFKELNVGLLKILNIWMLRPKLIGSLCTVHSKRIPTTMMMFAVRKFYFVEIIEINESTEWIHSEIRSKGMLSVCELHITRKRCFRGSEESTTNHIAWLEVDLLLGQKIFIPGKNSLINMIYIFFFFFTASLSSNNCIEKEKFKWMSFFFFFLSPTGILQKFLMESTRVKIDYLFIDLSSFFFPHSLYLRRAAPTLCTIDR